MTISRDYWYELEPIQETEACVCPLRAMSDRPWLRTVPADHPVGIIHRVRLEHRHVLQHQPVDGRLRQADEDPRGERASGGADGGGVGLGRLGHDVACGQAKVEAQTSNKSCREGQRL